MAQSDYTIARGAVRAVETNKVLKNTYLLLSGTLAFSAVIPASLMLVKPIRRSLAGVGIAASMVVLGMIWHRLDVSSVAFARPEAGGEEIEVAISWESPASGNRSPASCSIVN